MLLKVYNSILAFTDSINSRTLSGFYRILKQSLNVSLEYIN